MKTWQKISLWALGIFAFSVSAANLFFMLHDRISSRSAETPEPAPLPAVAEWKRYEFPAAGFSALFPSPPNMKVETPETTGDPDENTDAPKYRMRASVRGADYRIVASQIPAGVKVELENMRALVNPGRGTDMIDRREIGKGNTLAYEMTFKSIDGTYQRVRSFLLDGKFFQVIVSASREVLDTAETAEFLGSVAVLH